MDALIKKPNETEFEYHKRLVLGKLDNKTLSEYDYTELAPFVYGQDYSCDVARRMMYGSHRTLLLLEKQKEEALAYVDGASEAIQKLTELKREIKKERYKLQTEKLDYYRSMREDARDEMFEEKVVKSIKENIKNCNLPKKINVTHNSRGAVLCFADCHFGKDFKVYGLNNEVINEYNPEIFYSRMEQIYNDTLEQIKKENLSELHIYNLGDSVEGFIRHSQLWSLRWGVVDSATIFGNYMGDWLKRLSKDVVITYFQTDGNHDELRLLDGKKKQHLCESAGKIVRNCIALKNEGNPNFKILENKTGLIYDEICGYKILGIHGEVTDLSKAIKEFDNIYDTKISYLFAGHKHHKDAKECGVRKGCIGVGSIVGSDDFSMQLRQVADATAVFTVFEVGKGKVDEHTCVLN